MSRCKISVDKFKTGDCCYIVDKYNKIKFCHVIKEITGEPGDVVVYQVQDAFEGRFMVVQHSNCAESESAAKKIIKLKKGKKNEALSKK